MQTVGIYMNARASGGAGHSFRNTLDRTLFRSVRHYRAPKGFEELENSLIQDLRSKVNGIICVGGDGTVNAVIQTMAYKDVGVLVVPAGTANDLATELGNTGNVKKLLQTINNDEYKYIDLISINGRYMATNGGFGIGSEVARKINELRQRVPFFKTLMKISGKKIYSLFIPTELMGLQFDTHKLAIESEQFTGNVECAALLINNQSTLAGTFKIAPFTKNDDGKFNVTIIKYSTRVKFIQTIMALAAGYYPSSDPDFISFETDQICVKKLDKGRRAEFFGDGELFGRDQNEWKINIERQALKVYSRNADKNLMNVANEVSLS